MLTAGLASLDRDNAIISLLCATHYGFIAIVRLQEFVEAKVSKGGRPDLRS